MPPQKIRAVLPLVVTHPVTTDFRLKAIKNKREAGIRVRKSVVLIKAGSNRKGKSGRNINKAGVNDSNPMLIEAAVSAVTDKPIKLSLEKTEKSFSLNVFFTATEHKNNKKQITPAKAHNAATGFGK